jgi:putative restriction endonuclease
VNYWWVNQNGTYKSEVPGGFLWSPKTKSNGHQNKFYDFMTEVRAGDVVFSFCDTKIKAVGIATASASTSPKPNFGKAGDSWSAKVGWMVPVEFEEFLTPIRPKDHIETLRALLPSKYAPLQSNGDGLQSVYLAKLPPPLAEQLIELIGPIYKLAISRLQTDAEEVISDEDKIEDALKGRTDIGATTRDQLVKARRGQGIFKTNVRLNEQSCRITGVDDIKHLRASHIKPWAASSDEEKLNGCNGLLLAPHVDHLFDCGYISFSDSGDVLVSRTIDQKILALWAIPPQMNVGTFNSEQCKFLNYHRTNVLKR